MKNNTLTQRVLRHCAGGRSERGSAIVLVLVAMVLMAILAGSLLQLARFERIPRSESNIEIVIESVIAEILNQATDDLLDEDGHFLNTGNVANGGGDEPWDFPWTNRFETGYRTADYLNGNPVADIRGGIMDDTWLAAHMPDFGTAGDAYNGAAAAADGNGTWRKITSLTGLYLRGPSGTSDLADGTGNLNEDPVDFANVNRRDMNIAASSNILVDSDGDGIGDSRWEWAPLRQIGGTQYVMAVRIVDLSARMDMNVATGRFVNTAASRSRGDSPSELNGQQFVEDVSTDSSLNTATTAREWLAVLNYHLSSNATPNAVTPLAAADETSYDSNSATPPIGDRRHHWTDGASRVSNRFVFNGEDPAGGTYDYSNGFFGLTDAFELLQGNGVNSANTTTAENLMPTLLRRGGQEDNFAVSPGSITNNNGQSWNESQFWFLDPRKHMSPFTGASIAAKPYAPGQTRQLKIDVNKAVQDAAGRTALRNRINAVLNTNPPVGGWVSAYPHLANTGELANQLTANIADYIDDDNLLTVVGDETGFEALPYIAEVYTQRHYESDAPTTPGSVLWEADGAQGYVIEIGNPFARDTSGEGRPVSLDNIWLDMNGTTTPLRGGAITGVPAELAPGEVLLIYRNSDGPLGALQNYYSATGANNENTEGTFSTVHTAQGPAMDGTDTNQTIGLRAALQGSVGSPAGWNYSACEIELGGLSVNEPSSVGILGGPGVFAYIQTTYAGHGTGLRMMTVTTGGGSNDYTENTQSLQDPSINCDIGGGTNNATRTIPSTLANESKSAPAGFAALGNDQIVWPDSERERMHWIGDLLQIPLIGPDRTASGNATTMAQTFADANTSGAITNFGMIMLYLPYQTGAAVIEPTAGYGAFNYPHALMLLEQLTTFNPATDGEDGDNQSDSGSESIASPDDDEVLVPGRLNLNTASYNTLVSLLPFPDLATRQDIAAAIIARRENMAQDSAYNHGRDDIPGIAYTTALYDQFETLPVNPSQVAGDTTDIGGVRVDLNDHETTLGTYVDPDGIANDREEELMLTKWLTEVADTRSDIFAAYIVVQGYPADNFSQGADESARLIVIFARSNVEGAGDRAVELGRFRIN